MTARDIVSRSPSYEQRPRLSRPGRRLVPEPLRAGTRVILRPAAPSPRAQARRKILAFYGTIAVMLLIGRAMEARTAKAQPEVAAAQPADVAGLVAFADAEPAELQVGEHTFVEIAPEQSALLTAPGEQRTALISHYWPPLGGVNCATFKDGQCVSNMASGLPWWAWVGRAAACPAELPFWTTVTLPGGETFVCLDRGGKVVTTAAGEIWIDLLVERAPVPYGTAVPVIVRYPWSEGQ